MMSRPRPRLIGRLLLCLALLFAQQAAIAHAFTHIVVKQSATLVTDSCADCLAHAQFFSALGSAQRAFAQTKPSPQDLALPATPHACIVTVSMFQPRAPPAA